MSRADIRREMDKRCPSASSECTCEDMLAELYRAEKMATLMIEVISAVVVIAKIIKVARAALKVIRAPRQLQQQMEGAQKQLEALDKNTKPIIQGEFERLIERQAEVAAKIEGGVVIRP